MAQHFEDDGVGIEAVEIAVGLFPVAGPVRSIDAGRCFFLAGERLPTDLGEPVGLDGLAHDV